MRCPTEDHESAEMLLAYCARTLGPKETETWERHLAGCASCRRMTEDQAALWRALDEWESVEVSAGFDRRLYARIEREVPWWERAIRPFRPMLLHRALPITAAACLAIVAGLLCNRADRIPAGVGAAPAEAVRADQVENQLQDMEMLRDFNLTLRTDAQTKL